MMPSTRNNVTFARAHHRARRRFRRLASPPGLGRANLSSLFQNAHFAEVSVGKPAFQTVELVRSKRRTLTLRKKGLQDH